MKTKAELLLSTSQKVFNVDDLAVLWQISERVKLWEIIKYYVRTERLFRIKRGVYTSAKEYSPLEAAAKLFPPAYVSLTTALALHGAYFQYSSEIHVMAQASKRIKIGTGHVIVYHQLKNNILLNPQGVVETDGYWTANLERAICDTSYLIPSFIFEHPQNVNPEHLEKISRLYNNSALQNRIKEIINQGNVEVKNNA